MAFFLLYCRQMKKDSPSVERGEVKSMGMSLSCIDLWKRREDDTLFCRVERVKWGTRLSGRRLSGRVLLLLDTLCLSRCFNLRKLFRRGVHTWTAKVVANRNLWLDGDGIQM